ncbi:Smad nuclear-interacting protein 1 [Coemansia sp. RSA 552]|nr:Smad nuclear-interacting protein 1 [Coemansia sp. RSA 552]
MSSSPPRSRRHAGSPRRRSVSPQRDSETCRARSRSRSIERRRSRRRSKTMPSAKADDSGDDSGARRRSRHKHGKHGSRSSDKHGDKHSDKHGDKHGGKRSDKRSSKHKERRRSRRESKRKDEKEQAAVAEADEEPMPTAREEPAPDTTRESQEPDTARENQEPDTAKEEPEPDTAAKVRRSPGADPGSEATPARPKTAGGEGAPTPDFRLSGRLAGEANTVNGVELKYSEPPEARRPGSGAHWRIYVFKDGKDTDMHHIDGASAYLFGRDRRVADIPTDHPSCSAQHAVLQFRLAAGAVKPYLLDLASTNGSRLNGERVQPQRYVELRSEDVIVLGFSSREYVLLRE